MTTGSKPTGNDQVVQEHCIDLPGESVQCWISGGTDKLKVILRKHRDVIFDIHLGDGKIYTLHSTESEFYNVRDKKLVNPSKHGTVTFTDGERLHIWVGRGFRGTLILRSGEQIIYKVEPNKWDLQKYSKDPKEKPAPIIIAVSQDTTTSQSTKKVTTQATKNEPRKSTTSPATLPAKAVSEDTSELSCPVICIVDGKLEGMPSHIVEHFKKGGDHSGFSDIDLNHVATRNWIWGQAAGTGAYIKDNWDWLRASLDSKTSKGFKLVKAQVHFVRGKVRFYFSGYSNANTVFGRGGFGPSHDRIISIFSGAGRTTSTFGATVKGIAGTFQKTALVSFIFGTATSIAEWKDDASKDGYDLAAALITTTIKTIVAAAATTLIVAAIISFVMLVVGAAVPVILVGAITVFTGVLANYYVETADKLAGRTFTHDQSSTDGTSSIIASWMRSFSTTTQEKIHQNWNYLMHKMTRDYQEIAF
jgi:hypothetical protein